MMARLRETQKGVQWIFSASDLMEVKERSQSTPLIAVIYDGYSVVSKVTGRAQVTQRWSVVVGTRKGEYQEPAMTNRRAAGEIVTSVINALHGWGSDEYQNARPFQLAGNAGTHLEDGLLLCPLLFETDVIVQ